MSVDLTSLQLRKLNQTNWEEYPVGGASLPPHDPGVYTLRVAKIEFDARDGYLVGLPTFTIEGPTEGRDPEVRDFLSNKPFERGRRKGACRAGDFLLAVGSEDRPGQDHQEWAEALKSTEGALVQANLDWSCYDSENEVEVAGTYDEFPPDPANPGKRQPYVESPGPDGKPRRLRARQRIRFYVSQSE